MLFKTWLNDNPIHGGVKKNVETLYELPGWWYSKMEMSYRELMGLAEAGRSALA